MAHLVKRHGSGFAEIGRVHEAPKAEGSKAKARRYSHRTLARLVREGRTEELAEIGIQVAADQPVPEGKVRSGAPRLRKIDGSPVRVWDLEDAPPPAAEPTAREKLFGLGLTPEELKELLAE